MQLEPFPYDEDDEPVTGVEAPAGDPVDDVSGAPKRRPRVEFFARRAFLSKDTGRWHQHPGGRNRVDAELVATAEPEDQG
jgi:hypothetical protein